MATYSRITKSPIATGSYHANAQKFIKSAHAQGRTVQADGSELIASRAPTKSQSATATAARNAYNNRLKQQQQAVKTKKTQAQNKPFDTHLPKKQKTFGVFGAK